MQLVLGWLHGSLLERQHQDLLDLREDVQELTDSLDQGDPQDDSQDESLAPARHTPAHRRRLQRVARIQAQPAEEEQARKELQDAQASAQQAVSQARKVQSQLSIEENMRKADEKAKVDAAENAWQKWLWGALGGGLVAMAVRVWLRRRN
ncbi:MAG TPA: hypothetical protein VN436_07880 [Holophaga sp.]|nr:hypothetical protein [Holophaga sp.]